MTQRTSYNFTLTTDLMDLIGYEKIILPKVLNSTKI